MSESVLPMFSSGSFMVSSFVFVSLIHFVFIFPCGVRECSSHIVSALCSCLAFPAPHIEESFLCVIFFLHLSYINCLLVCGFMTEIIFSHI